MVKELKIGIIGDFNPSNPSHRATTEAIQHAAARLEGKPTISWLPTVSFLKPVEVDGLSRFDAVWAAPGSPNQSMEGALLAIRQVRLLDKPFFGT
jgi:CTP synthase (UTP-ammonia lyase)